MEGGGGKWRRIGFEQVVGRLCELRRRLVDEGGAGADPKPRPGPERRSLGSGGTPFARLPASSDADKHESLFSLVELDEANVSFSSEDLDASGGAFDFVDQEGAVVLSNGRGMLGKGSCGAVYRGTLSVKMPSDVEVEYDVAVKISRLDVQVLDDIDRWMRVVKLLQLMVHPTLSYCYYVGLAESVDEEGAIKMYSAHEIALGGTLAAALNKEERCTEDVIRKVLIDILSALCYLHGEMRMVHNDIKPQNIVLVRDEGSHEVRYKLTDLDCIYPIISPPSSPAKFDAETILDKSKDDASVLTYGTAPYMSPESSRGMPFLPSNDTWSLGILTYQLSTGRLPWNSLELTVPSMILHRLRKSFSSTCVCLTLDEFEQDHCHVHSENLKDIVRVCLTNDFSRRPTAAELLRHPFLCSSSS